MDTTKHDEWFPNPTLQVYSPSGKHVGYGCDSIDGGCEVYLPGGDAEGFAGIVVRSQVEFSSGALAGRIQGNQAFFDDGEFAGELIGNEFVDCNKNVIATVVGESSTASKAGAVLLLVLCRWFNADGSVNERVR